MIQSVVHIALVVRDYDEAIEFYTKKLHFTLVEDTYQPEQDKRWVVVSPPGIQWNHNLLGRASSRSKLHSSEIRQEEGFFCFWEPMIFGGLSGDERAGYSLHQKPKEQDYGTVAVFEIYMATYGIWLSF